jgi:hypothetical protein
VIIPEDELMHYGTPRKSGRYPWGSGGENTSERNTSFLAEVDRLRALGLTDTQIADGMKMSTSEWRAIRSIAVNERRAARVAQAVRLKETGMGDSAIAREMGLPSESSVRSLLAANESLKIDRNNMTADRIRETIDSKGGFVDVGAGTEHYLGVSAGTLKNAIAILRAEGYGYHRPKLPQLGTNHETTYRLMSAPGVHTREVYNNLDKIHLVEGGRSLDGGSKWPKLEYPTAISSKRVDVRWAEDGGDKEDGVIYVRPGVKDTSLGGKNYAQVRILVDGTHYLKGMAMYKDDMPKGVDLQFNTNKSKHDPKMAGDKKNAMKPISTENADSPWNAIIKHQHGVMNIVKEEGNWDTEKANFSSQFLSKQKPSFAKQQLDMTYERKKSELDEIMSLTNPTVRKKLLEEFAESLDSSAVHLEAASLPRTASHVIMPINSIKETEIYAPKLKNGDRVALVRHPHGGPFEIPELTVNNKNPEARKKLGTSAADAVGIHHKVAEKLSGADFDGDSVLVIKNNQGKVKSEPSLAGLKDFDPKSAYPEYPGMRYMSKRDTQMEMGKISNLITDMTIKSAPTREIVQAVRHSMVVIDAEKHKLNYKQSELDNGIKALKKKWQGREDSPTYGGAATLISRAKSPLDVPERAQGFRVNPDTGEKIYRNTNAPDFVNKAGVVKKKTTRVTKLGEAKDAHTLSSGTPIERIYADHSNRLKAMANAVRKEAYHTKGIQTSPSAKKAYNAEVLSLKAKLQRAQENAPLERQAQLIGNSIIRQKRQANPDMSKEALKKLKNDTLKEARERTGASKNMIDITPREWDAIQAGAVSPSMLTDILNNTKPEKYKALATPRTQLKMTATKVNRAKAMLMAGYTQAEVAENLGVSLTTLKTSLK